MSAMADLHAKLSNPSWWLELQDMLAGLHDFDNQRYGPTIDALRHFVTEVMAPAPDSAPTIVDRADGRVINIRCGHCSSSAIAQAESILCWNPVVSVEDDGEAVSIGIMADTDYDGSSEDLGWVCTNCGHALEDTDGVLDSAEINYP